MKELASGELVEVAIDGLSIYRNFYFIQRIGTENNGLVKTFIQFTQRFYSKLE
ncbi:MAG: hypothetical protein R2822_31510 [Spirosomataceae bacterium]